MSKKEKNWKRFYLFIMIFFYAIYVPVSVAEWLLSDGGFPLTAIIVGFSLPFIRKNHLNRLHAENRAI